MATATVARLKSREDTKTTSDKIDTILVFDFGGQYCHLIARNVRELGVYSEIVNHKTTAKDIEKLEEKLNIKGIILSGGPKSVYDKNAPSINKEILKLGIPILGLCYGHQLIAHVEKGRVEPALKKEYGEALATVDRTAGILKGLNDKINVWMSHGDTVFAPPKDYEILAHTNNTPVAAFKHKERHIYGLQWHPEVLHTENGQQIIKNFALDICDSKPEWKLENFVENTIEDIRKRILNGRGIVALSGGVDSSVSAAIVGKAIGNNLTAIYVDTGLMRENETEKIKDQFKNFGLDFRVIDARSRFLKALSGIEDPERKRKIIGRLFVRVFEEAAKDIKADFLVQGTIYPDRVESGMTGVSATIKTHYNVGGIPKNIKFKSIIEP